MASRGKTEYAGTARAGLGYAEIYSPYIYIVFSLYIMGTAQCFCRPPALITQRVTASNQSTAFLRISLLIDLSLGQLPGNIRPIGGVADLIHSEGAMLNRITLRAL